MRLICWFRRDLRLTDHRALDYAVQASQGAVIPVFIVDDAILADPSTGAAITATMLAMLRGLDASLRNLGSKLIICHGEPAAVLLRVLDESQADGVVWNRDYTPQALQRDYDITQTLLERGYRTQSFDDAMLVEPGALLKPDGTPYQTFTPYFRRWLPLALEQSKQLAPAPQGLAAVPENIARQPIPTLRQLGFEVRQTIPLPCDERSAKHQLSDFLNTAGLAYATDRDEPGLDGTSQLSRHLRMGTLSPRQCLNEADHHPNPHDAWIRQLAWRDFYTQLGFFYPHMFEEAFDRRYNAIQWLNHGPAFEAWCQGQTGYPLIDAGMRQLNQDAWMHNRVRMVVASFLVKHLLIDWRWGARYFMRQLCDADEASNNGGWQWAAGSGGASSQPYFRILNPTRQIQRYVSAHAYIRRYVPELRQVPDRYLAEPWMMPDGVQRQSMCRIGHDYPIPIIDHHLAHDRALTAYRSVLQNPTSSEDNQC